MDVGSYHAFVSHATLPELVRFYGRGAAKHREYLQGICKGSKRACRKTCCACVYCPVNWDCATLKAERIRLGWNHDE